MSSNDASGDAHKKAENHSGTLEHSSSSVSAGQFHHFYTAVSHLTSPLSLISHSQSKELFSF